MRRIHPEGPHSPNPAPYVGTEAQHSWRGFRLGGLGSLPALWDYRQGPRLRREPKHNFVVILVACPAERDGSWGHRELTSTRSDLWDTLKSAPRYDSVSIQQ